MRAKVQQQAQREGAVLTTRQKLAMQAEKAKEVAAICCGESLAADVAELAADESLKVNYELSRRVALTWMKRNISFAFIRWRNNAKAYKMQRRRLETALVRMTSRVSFAAFSASCTSAGAVVAMRF